MNKSTKIKIIAIIAVLVLAITGVIVLLNMGGENENSYPAHELFYQGDSTKVNKTDEQKETFVIGSSRIPLDVKPYFHDTEVGRAITNLVYEPLANVSASGVITPVLAKSITFSADGLIASVSLKDAAFSDGSKVTAQDIVDSYLEYFKPGSIYYDIDRAQTIKGFYDYIIGTAESFEGIHAVSEDTIEFKFTELSAKNATMFDIPVIKTATDGSYAIGTGEYKIASITPGTAAELSRNDKNTERKYPYNKFIFKSFSSAELEENIKGFSLDLFMTNTGTMLDSIKEAGYHNVYRIRGNEYSYIGFNLSSTIGSNLNVRKAIAYAIDRSKIGSAYYQDYLPSLGTLSTSKTGNSFAGMYPQDVEKATQCVTDAANDLSDVLDTEPDILTQTKLTAKYLCQSDSYSNGFYLNMQESLLEAKLELTAESVYETEYEQTLASMSGFDIYHKLNYENSPIDVVESIIMQNGTINEEYKEMLRAQYLDDYTKIFDKAEQFVDSRCLIIPTFVDDSYVAISSDCDNSLMLDLIQ